MMHWFRTLGEALSFRDRNHGAILRAWPYIPGYYERSTLEYGVFVPITQRVGAE